MGRFSMPTYAYVRSSNLFGRASNPLILILNFRAHFPLLTLDTLGQHRGNTRLTFASKSHRSTSSIRIRSPNADLPAGRRHSRTLLFGRSLAVGSVSTLADCSLRL